jgi:hypothetical protein
MGGTYQERQSGGCNEGRFRAVVRREMKIYIAPYRGYGDWSIYIVLKQGWWRWNGMQPFCCGIRVVDEEFIHYR